MGIELASHRVTASVMRDTHQNVVEAQRLAIELTSLVKRKNHGLYTPYIDIERVDMVRENLQRLCDEPQETAGKVERDIYSQQAVMEVGIALNDLSDYINDDASLTKTTLGDSLRIAREFARNPDRYVCLVDA